MDTRNDMRDLAAALTTAGIADDVTVHPLPANTDVIQIKLAADSPRKAQVLRRCLDFFTARDMIAGKRATSDTTLYLHVRGSLPTGKPVIVSAPFDETVEIEQVAVIDDEINAQRVYQLVEQLVAVETAAKPHRAG